MKGACLCGAVRVEVTEREDWVSACHCDLCRIWSGSAFWGFAAPDAAVTVTGTPARYRSSSFAERAFCGTCGTHLWLRDDDADHYEFCPGLFEDLRDAPLTREVYADRAFACVPLEGTHPRVSRQEYERDFPHVQMEGSDGQI
ncbi:GFA family protein [Sulfitobacter sp. D35]|uniref:GFA family protein n=1 Tax=Sulfitobacter sp. D35 TaxID=3083252 RepID=UPI00296EDA73|nr:GFA family protein [Sulfitobacter sp. D35]MDW4498185.1 GFA family protein [Sulfitobacter sp. D35]